MVKKTISPNQRQKEAIEFACKQALAAKEKVDRDAQLAATQLARKKSIDKLACRQDWVESKAKEDTVTQLAKNQIALGKVTMTVQEKEDIVDQLDKNIEAKAQKQQHQENQG